MYLEHAGFTDIRVNYGSIPSSLVGSLLFLINAAVWQKTGKKRTWSFLWDSKMAQLVSLPITKLMDLAHLGDAIELTATKKEVMSR